jgi:DeoR/GlpR family transcriptional regulator of sugar metabolism
VLREPFSSPRTKTNGSGPLKKQLTKNAHWNIIFCRIQQISTKYLKFPSENLTTFERRYRLLNILREQPGIRVPDLARILVVSEGTIRNDLKALAASGQLTRVWGGGIPAEEESSVSLAYAARARMNQSAKQSIARMAARLVSDGDSLLLDASTTVYHMAYYLQERHNLTILTNGIEVGRELAQDHSNTVILFGGILRPDGTAITRPSNERLFNDLYIKTAFMSSSGFSIETGLTEVDINEAQFKRSMIAAASKLVALIDSSKFGKVDLTSCARIEQVSHLFSDAHLSSDWEEKLIQARISYTLCSETSETIRK